MNGENNWNLGSVKMGGAELNLQKEVPACSQKYPRDGEIHLQNQIVQRM